MRIRSATIFAAACLVSGGMQAPPALELGAMAAEQEAILSGKWVKVNNENDRLPLQGEALAATTRCTQPMFATAEPETAADMEPAEGLNQPGVTDEPEAVSETADFDYSELTEMPPPDPVPLPRFKPIVEADFSDEMIALFPDPGLAEGDIAFFPSGEHLVMAERDGPSANLWRIGVGVARTEIGPQFVLEFLDGWEEGEWRKALSSDNDEIVFLFQIGQDPVYDFFFSQSNVVGIGTFLKCAA